MANLDITTIIVDLYANRVVSYDFSSRVPSEFLNRLDKNPDYRQAMLSYCLKVISGEEKEKAIQQLLPERLLMHLRTHSQLAFKYHLVDNGIPVLASLKVEWVDKTKGLVKFTISATKEEVKKYYKVGSRKIVLIAKECDSACKFFELLKPNYDVESLLPTDGSLIRKLKDMVNELSVILLCSKELSLVNVLRNNPELKDIPIAMMTSEEILESEKLFADGISDILNINENHDLIINRVNNLCMIHDYTQSIIDLEYDKETGLLNFDFFKRKATELFNKTQEELILVLFEIESLRMYSEKYGNAVSDIIVKYAVSQIKNLLPGIIISGRCTDDKFVIIRKNERAEGHDSIAKFIKENSPLPNLVIKAGVAVVEKGSNIVGCISRAETAIEKIRNAYGVHSAFYDEKMYKEELKKQQILSSMELALEDHQFTVYYQPKHVAGSEELGGAEALVRWTHPEYGVMSPAEFLPIFERVGFIRGLDRFIWGVVLRNMVEWRARGFKLVPISINISRRDFETGDLGEWIINMVRKNNLDPSLIHIEITESAFIENPGLITKCSKELHDEGFIIELDDFGVGYSSLTTLNSLELDVLKIDRSILLNDDRTSKKNVLEFCIELAKVMGLKTVCEGVEEKEQVDRVTALGADYIQGYYYSKPLPKNEFEEYMKKYDDLSGNN